jgi:D-serine deaminase-like pyridoxal phosphate-dependent protein
MKLHELDTPVLLVDLDALERNIARMRDLTAAAGIACRPHAKAHKTPVIAQMQREAGAVGVCCAKLGEAEVLAASGVDDILITTPVIGASKLGRLMHIANQATIAVVVDDAENVAEIARAAHTAGVRTDVVIEVDVGQHRCGVQPGEPAVGLAQAIAGQRWLNLRGLQGYQGSIQMVASFAERRAATRAAHALLAETAEAVRRAGIPVSVLTGGGSGTSVIDAAEHGLTEVQPGGYIFMDSRYRKIEWDTGDTVPFEQALSLLAGVVSRPAADRAIVDMGLKAVSSDGGIPVPVDVPGATFAFGGEEHGQLSWNGARCPLALGDKVRFHPTHCDTTVNLHDQYIVHRGDEVVDVWPIPARGRVQ